MILNCKPVLFLLRSYQFSDCLCHPVLDLVKSKPRESVRRPDAKCEETIKDKGQLNLDVNVVNLSDICKGGTNNGIRAQTFSFDELQAATGNFRKDCLLGEGGFGKVYKGRMEGIDQVG